MWLEKYWATFKPLRVDDLRPEAAAIIGRRILVEYVGVVEGGDYEGQRHYMPVEYDFPYPGWIPECDLYDVVGSSENGDMQDDHPVS